jgi:hypothetical protein
MARWGEGRWSSRALAAAAVAVCGLLAVDAAAIAAPSLPSATAAAGNATARHMVLDVNGDLIATADQHAREDESAVTEKPTPPAKPLRVRSNDATAIGYWQAPIFDKSGVVGIHSVLLRTGKVLMWSPRSVQSGGQYEIQTIASVWDPATGTSVRVDPPEDANVFCGGAAILSDGTVLVVGGLDPYHGWWGSRGNPVVLLFNPTTQTWTQAKSMVAGRWYPTVTALADGSAFIVGGRDVNEKPNTTIERVGPLPSTDPQVVGQYPLNYQQGLYPNQFLLPNGLVFSFVGDKTNFLDPTTWRINKGPVPLAPEFNYPNAVVLPMSYGQDVQMVVYGGKDKFAGTTTSVASKIDLSSSTPTFTALTPMPQPRTNMNSVLLPDGTILVVGGNAVDQFTTPYLQSLLYDPATDTWTPLASQVLRRAYHSTAILLPDGRVLSAGDNGAGTIGGHNREELYYPPYMFRGSRPSITQAPTTATVGNWYGVVTTGPVSRAVIISPAATTHATNANQRMIDLPSVPLYDHGLAVNLPADGTIPPGPYMLFALDANNTPSIATWVQVS